MVFLPPPTRESQEALPELRKLATALGVAWSLEDSVSDIRVAINYRKDQAEGTYKRLPKFFQPLRAPPDPDKETAEERAAREKMEAIMRAEATKKRLADPLKRVHASPLNGGLPFGK